MKKFYLLSICLALFFSILIVGNLEAATYYIYGSNGNDSNPGSLASPWKTFNKANSTLVAGDTVYIRAGIYTSEQIKPSNSGTSGNYIIYQNYNGESVTLSEHNVPLYLYGNDYIKIDGIRFQNCVRFFVLLGGANYNIISNCTFYHATAYFGSLLSARNIDPNTGVAGDYIVILNNYNQILNNVWENAPDGCPDIGDAQDCDTYPADNFYIQYGAYNLIQDNTFGNTSHDGLTIGLNGTKNNVVRDNLFQNTYRRGLNMYTHTYQNLIENNRFYDQGLNIADNPRKDSRDQTPWNPVAIQSQKASHNHIFRNNIFDNNGKILSLAGEYNYFYHNTANEQICAVYSEGGDWNGYGDWKYNRFKNNIFANTQSLGRSDDTSYLYNWHTYVQPGYVCSDNVITRNSFTGTTNKWRFKGLYLGTFAEWKAKTSEIYDNIWGTDPLFTNESNRDFTLQAGSPMINAGAWLTTITSATNAGQTSFTVNDTGYFYDGWGIPSQIGDVIKTANGKVTTITKIDYDRNRITVSPAIDIVNGEGLSLNYSGSAPDIGAHEYGNAITITPPAHLRLLSN